MTDSNHVSAILLAAGRSKRLGRNKLLLPLGADTVIRKTAKVLLESSVSEVILVTGHAEAMIKDALKELDVCFTHNPRYAEGQSTSVIAGLNAAAKAADAYLFALGDQPLLTPEIVDDIIALYGVSRPRTQIVVPLFEGRRGNPTLFSASLTDELRRITGDEGGRRIIQKLEMEFPEKIVFLHLRNGNVFLDIDTEKDYQIALHAFSKPSFE